MKKILLASLFLLFASASYAQGATASWGQSESVAISQGFTYTLKVDALAPVTLAQTCATVNSQTQCQATFTLANPSATHTYVLTASNSFGSTSVTLGPGAIPSTTLFKVIIIGN